MTGDATPPAQRDEPWLFRTYSGHSSAAISNALYRTNLARGQTGLSVAFDLPTQTGYDSDHPLAREEIGKVGVPIAHLGDMLTLFDGLPLDRLNTSMTINATAPWLFALYIAAAERLGADRAKLQGTVQNDIVKEYLARGTYIFPPEPSLRLAGDVIAFAYREVPKWNPINICSYHLQEAGATPIQELAFALATAIAVLDRARSRPDFDPADFPALVGRISFFVNAGIRFVTEMCKMRAFGELWDEICRTRYGIAEEKYRRFRYGVQVNSLGLTANQPENNVYRILLETLAVTLSRNARARAVQLPAWNEALGLPRPWDQQWSLRLQQILAYETDLLEFPDLFDGSPAIAAKVEELKGAARTELAAIESQGGVIATLESGYLKSRLIEANAARLNGIESGETVIVGVNRFQESAPSPLADLKDGGVIIVDEAAADAQIRNLRAWRAERDPRAVAASLAALEADARAERNIMPASIACAKAGCTTGEWGDTLRRVYGEYRAPTGLDGAAIDRGTMLIAPLGERCVALTERLGRNPSLLMGKPGLDGHSNGAEQIALRARAIGFDVLYDGIRSAPAEIIAVAREKRPHVIGLSILSGSHVPLVREIMAGLRAAGLGDIPVIVGGIIPAEDELILRQCGVARIYTPKDFDIGAICGDILGLVEATAPR